MYQPPPDNYLSCMIVANCIDPIDPEPELMRIFDQVCDHLKVSPGWVLKRGRQPVRVYAKQLYCYLAKHQTTFNENAIAELICCTRSYVGYALKQISDLSDVDKDVRNDLKNLTGGMEGLKAA